MIINYVSSFLAIVLLASCNSGSTNPDNSYKDSLIKRQSETINQLQNKVNELKRVEEPTKLQSQRSDSFTIGSSEDDVLAIQGEPTSIFSVGNLKSFSYGLSSITFNNGAVESYTNAGTLKIKLRAQNPDTNNTDEKNDAAKIDLKFGFRDLKLESDFETLNAKYTLTKTNSNDLTESYDLKGTTMYIDDIFIEYINLSFIDQKLFEITMKIDCDKQTSHLTALVEEGYGKLKKDPESHIFSIKGKKAELHYQLSGKQLDNGYIAAYAYLSIKSTELMKRITGTDNKF